MFTEQERIEFNQKNETMWQERVKCGAALLDEIFPGWEWKIDVGEIRIGWYGKDVLSLLYHVSDMQQVLPLVFAGKGLSGNCGRRPQPGPPPDLTDRATEEMFKSFGIFPKSEDIWKYTVSGAHHIASEEYGFISCPSKYPHSIDNAKLSGYWMGEILLRAIVSVQT